MAFIHRHNDRCLEADITKCECHDLVQRAREYEANIENEIKTELVWLMNEEKNVWVNSSEKSDFVAWIDSLWANAIDFVAKIK